MQIEHIKRVKTALFPQDILVWDCGVVIEEVDQGFIQYAIEFTEKQTEYISLLQEQEKTVEYVLKRPPYYSFLYAKSLIENHLAVDPFYWEGKNNIQIQIYAKKFHLNIDKHGNTWYNIEK